MPIFKEINKINTSFDIVLFEPLRKRGSFIYYFQGDNTQNRVKVFPYTSWWWEKIEKYEDYKNILLESKPDYIFTPNDYRHHMLQYLNNHPNYEILYILNEGFTLYKQADLS